MVIIWLCIWKYMASAHPTVLLSYDVPRDMRTTAAKVSHIIFGRRDQAKDGPPPFIERPGVVWLGQSVLLLPAPLARELTVRLEALGARVAVAHVDISPSELEAFRRRMRRRPAS